MRRPPPLSRLPFAVIACALCLAAESVTAKDLGTRGAVWPVAEPDLLLDIEARLKAMETTDVLPARVRRTRLFDPSVTLEEDVRAADGTLLAARGARVNPLTTHPLTRDLLFIDGTRPVEVAWALRHEKPSVIVLLAGRPLDLTRAHGRVFFFDQGGRLTRRFGLLATPSVVAAAGSTLKITEVPLEDKPDPLGEGDRP